MGCLVEKTDTGIEVELHLFDDFALATHYMTVGRGYEFDRHEPWMSTPGFDFYNGPNGKLGCVRILKGMWRAVFWNG